MTLCVRDRLWIIMWIEQLLDLSKQAQRLKHLQKIAEGDAIRTCFQRSNGRGGNVGQVAEFFLRQAAQLPRQSDPDAQALQGAAHHDGNGSRFRASQGWRGVGHRGDSRCFRCYRSEIWLSDTGKTLIHPRSSTWESLLGARFDSTRCADGLRCLGSETRTPIVPMTTNSPMESGEDPSGSAKLPRLKPCLNRAGVRPASSIAQRMAYRLRPDSGHVLGFGKMSVGEGIAGTTFAGSPSERQQLRSRSGPIPNLSRAKSGRLPPLEDALRRNRRLVCRGQTQQLACRPFSERCRAWAIRLET